MKNHNLNPNPKIKKKLRKFGFTFVSIGGILLLIGFINIFTSFGSFEPPKFVWTLFLGIPMTGIGGMLLSYGYMGEVSRYTSSQIAPVAKDTINYMVDGTKDSISDLVRSIKNDKSIINCPSCNQENDNDALFCKACGKTLFKECPKCQTKNDSDSEFCKKCGEDI